MLNKFETDLIQRAFFKCFGLKKAVNEGKDYAITELKHQTGLRIGFIKSHIEEIKKLPTIEIKSESIPF